MPKTKQFEAYSIQDMIFGGKPKLYSMEEISRQFFQHIEQVYEFLNENKVISIEIPIEDRLYHIKKIDSANFRITGVGGSPAESRMFDGIETVNWLFEKAPFISLVGVSNIE